jgi:hypothetical protein
MREAMSKNWTGLYIPPLPHKQYYNNEQRTVDKRVHFLDRFMKGVATLPYLYESDEFCAFVSPKEGRTVEKELEMLMKRTKE